MAVSELEKRMTGFIAISVACQRFGDASASSVGHD
jgi:hypothetical protein